MMINQDLVNKKISVTMMSGDRRQGKLISINERGTFTINWKKDPKDSQFFRTELQLDRVESVTELIYPPRVNADVPVRVENDEAPIEIPEDAA